MIPFFPLLALADCAARAIADGRKIGEKSGPADRKYRIMMRREPVEALRYLWNQAETLSDKTTVAMRIAVWLGRDTDKVKALVERGFNSKKKEGP